MVLERKRVASNSSRNGVAVGSVWESRMRGGFKVFNGDEKTETDNNEMVEKKVAVRSKQTSSNEVINGVGKRKTWKSEAISEARSELSEIKKSPPIENKKGRPEWNSTRIIKTRSLSKKEITTSNDICNGIEKTKSLPISHESKLGIQEIKSQDEELDDPKLLSNDTMEENKERAIVVVQQIEPISAILKQVVVQENKMLQKIETSQKPISKSIEKQPPAVVNHNPRNIPKPSQAKFNVAQEFPSKRAPKSHNKLQTFIDLIMWRDVSRSSLIFGMGTFSILSSSFTQDLNISFISVISYLGLIYLAAIFIFKSFIFRGVVEKDDIRDDEEFVVVGEEEAIWALKIFLPYINEFLLNVKALFSGDPSTTMKLAVLLFILAKCGSSITIWKMAKLGFFGVFTVPKICSLYSSQFTAYGTFWVGRFKDAWESCSQKKAVALGVFTLVWNLSSIIARIWAVFMLLVAFKYYQQTMMKDEVVSEEEPISRRNQTSWQEHRNTKTGSTKLKKRS